MFTKISLFVAAALVLASFLGLPAANAQSLACPFNLPSLQGNYAVVGNYVTDVAMTLGMSSVDGNRNLKGTFVINEPTAGSTTGARTILTGTNVGACAVNGDSAGTVAPAATATTEIVLPAAGDFVITSAVHASSGTGTLLIAPTITDAQEIPSGIEGTFVAAAITCGAFELAANGETWIINKCDKCQILTLSVGGEPTMRTLRLAKFGKVKWSLFPVTIVHERDC